MLMKKLMTLSVILIMSMSCITLEGRKTLEDRGKETWSEGQRDISDVALVIPSVKRSVANDCDSVLKKCSLAFEAQKKSLAKQSEVIETQDELIKVQEQEIERSQSLTKKAVTGGISVSSALLLLLLL